VSSTTRYTSRLQILLAIAIFHLQLGWWWWWISVPLDSPRCYSLAHYTCAGGSSVTLHERYTPTVSAQLKHMRTGLHANRHWYYMPMGLGLVRLAVKKTVESTTTSDMLQYPLLYIRAKGPSLCELLAHQGPGWSLKQC
jgi:hypothetical protein